MPQARLRQEKGAGARPSPAAHGGPMTGSPAASKRRAPGGQAGWVLALALRSAQGQQRGDAEWSWQTPEDFFEKVPSGGSAAGKKDAPPMPEDDFFAEEIHEGGVTSAAPSAPSAPAPRPDR